MSEHKLHLLINNLDVLTETYAKVRDPGKTSVVVGQVAQATLQQVDDAVEAAHQAFLKWRHTTLTERLGLVLQAADLLEGMAEELTPVVVSETGMMPHEIALEIRGAAFAMRDNVEAARVFLAAETFEDGDSWVSVEKVPVGVVAAFAPWNAPIVLLMRKLAPALACGNSLVVKTPPTAPLGQGIVLKKIASLFPPGVINVLHGGNEVGERLVGHKLVRRISFTGGGKAASAIMANAAETLKGVQFELGGNDPAIVLSDFDIDKMMPSLVSGTFHRSGQFCFAIKRIYVPAAIYNAFFERMAAEVAKFRVGHPLDNRTTFGPVNNKNQYKFVRGLIERARQAGAIIVELGEKVDADTWEDGYYILPTLVKNAENQQEIVSCEQFGPVVPVLSYDSEEEAIAMANSTEFGLGSSVWSSNFDRAVAFSKNIEAGMTFINKNAQSRLGRRRMPFGGIKQSGIGTENSEHGLTEYIEYHAINFHKKQ